MYALAIQLIRPFNQKAKLWYEGRKNQMITRPNTSKKIIWMHCSSLGEFEQGRPVLEQLQETGDYHIVLTFFSPSGYEVRKNYQGADQIYYLPSDTVQNAKAFLDIIQADMALFVKYDLWFNYLRILQERQVPIILFAALFRGQQYFFKPYGKSFNRILKGFEKIFVQNQDSFDLLQEQGFQNMELSGDTRIDRVLTIASEQRVFPWLERFGAGKDLLICGSTWQKDEDVLLEAFNEKMQSAWKLLLAPHDIQKSHIAALTKQIDVSYILYSELEQGGNLAEAKILIVDNIGMLNQLYRYAKISYVGGGFGAGIHNTLEPIAFQKPVLFGPKYQKFEEAKALVISKGGFCVENAAHLTEVIASLSRPEIYEAAAKQAFAYVKNNQGASLQVTRFIQSLSK